MRLGKLMGWDMSVIFSTSCRWLLLDILPQKCTYSIPLLLRLSVFFLLLFSSFNFFFLFQHFFYFLPLCILAWCVFTSLNKQHVTQLTFPSSSSSSSSSLFGFFFVFLNFSVYLSFSPLVIYPPQILFLTVYSPLFPWESLWQKK